MNIILFQPSEVEPPLPRKDARAVHILNVLRLSPGGKFDAGLIDGPIGKGVVVAIHPNSLTLSFAWEKTPPALYPIHLVIGLPRPQTARDILRDATTLGVSAIDFVATARGEASYASSRLWKSDDWTKCVISGAAQAFCTRLPRITSGGILTETIARLPIGGCKIALDNYEASGPLGNFPVRPDQSVILAIGSERGWSEGERIALREAGFIFTHLGPRVLRTETAVIAAASLIRSKLGLS